MASSGCPGRASAYSALAASALLLAGCGTEPLRDTPSASASTATNASPATSASPSTEPSASTALSPSTSTTLSAAAVAVAGPAAPTVAGPPATDPGVVLPEGQGREILLAKCLGCHDLGGLELFGAFYRRDDWRALVETMVTHGAAVDALEVEVLSEYLATYFGPPE